MSGYPRLLNTLQSAAESLGAAVRDDDTEEAITPDNVAATAAAK
ncbi:hypothetical protein [Couchioplanes azureus]|nr:hypothetical protein [Couchioplanes caeruleus]GGQ60857.1 hypothetical protein GCM10010166_33150 [Couchioplanes caeruleus subsp. azureus]